VKIDRYSEEVVEGNSEYDALMILTPWMNMIDRFALCTLLQKLDLQSDPATRSCIYHIAKNQFERVLSDAQTYRVISNIFWILSVSHLQP